MAINASALSASSGKATDPYSALLQLISQQLIPDYVRQQNNQEQETLNAQALQGQYSRENAVSDSTNAVTAAIAAALQEVMPGITKASEGAGSSQNSMRALLTQDAATQAGDKSAIAQLQQLVQYGQIQSQLEQVIGSLVKPGDSLLNIFSQLLASTGNANASSSGRTTGTSAVDPYSQTPGGRWGSSTVFTPAPAYGSSGPAATQEMMDASFWAFNNRDKNFSQMLMNASAPSANTSNTGKTPTSFEDLSAWSKF